MSMDKFRMPSGDGFMSFQHIRLVVSSLSPKLLHFRVFTYILLTKNVCVWYNETVWSDISKQLISRTFFEIF